jgi:hypothetical protein
MITMKRASTFGIVAAALTASLAHGETKPGAPPVVQASGTPPQVIGGFNGDYDFSGKALLTNPTLMKEIDDTLIKGASCRTMAQIGYGNGYQCPAAGVAACMTMLKAGKVDACAKLDDRDYLKGCGAGEASSPDKRANSTCSDLSADLWASLAVRAPYAVARARLEAFGCKAEAGTTMFCKSHTREHLCQPFERAGVVVCRPPKIVKECTGGEFPQCSSVET